MICNFPRPCLLTHALTLPLSFPPSLAYSYYWSVLRCTVGTHAMALLVCHGHDLVGAFIHGAQRRRNMCRVDYIYILYRRYIDILYRHLVDQAPQGSPRRLLTRGVGNNNRIHGELIKFTWYMSRPFPWQIANSPIVLNPGECYEQYVKDNQH